MQDPLVGLDDPTALNRFRADPSHPRHPPVLPVGGDGLGAGSQLRPRRLGAGGQGGVEILPGPHQREIRCGGRLREGQLQLLARGDDADAARPVVGVEFGLQAHLPDHRDRPRRQAVATGLGTGEGLLLELNDLGPGPGQEVGRRGASRPPTNHDDVTIGQPDASSRTISPTSPGPRRPAGLTFTPILVER